MGDELRPMLDLRDGRSSAPRRTERNQRGRLGIQQPDADQHRHARYQRSKPGSPRSGPACAGE
jgi:hypothetical protein